METKFYIPPEPGDLPDIQLYMDQMVEFMNEKMKDLDDKSGKVLLTKTMVNNYVKSGILDKPEKKRYSKEQVMKLFMVCHLKSVLSMDEISILLKEASKYGSVEEAFARYRSVCLDFKEDPTNSPDALNHRWEWLVYHAIAGEWHRRAAKGLLQADHDGQTAHRP